MLYVCRFIKYIGGKCKEAGKNGLFNRGHQGPGVEETGLFFFCNVQPRPLFNRQEAPRIILKEEKKKNENWKEN